MTFLFSLSKFQEMLRHWGDTRTWMELDWGLYWSRWACWLCIKIHTLTLLHTPQVDNPLMIKIVLFLTMRCCSYWQLPLVYLTVCATYLILSLSKFHIVKWSSDSGQWHTARPVKTHLRFFGGLLLNVFHFALALLFSYLVIKNFRKTKCQYEWTTETLNCEHKKCAMQKSHEIIVVLVKCVTKRKLLFRVEACLHFLRFSALLPHDQSRNCTAHMHSLLSERPPAAPSSAVCPFQDVRLTEGWCHLSPLLQRWALGQKAGRKEEREKGGQWESQPEQDRQF